jgi:hypothetical protein
MSFLTVCHPREADCVTIRKRRHCGQPGAAGRDPESRLYQVKRAFLDPGSRPATRDLAGMTNCDTGWKAGISSLTNCNKNDFEIPACAGMTEIKRILTFFERIKFETINLDWDPAVPEISGT